MREFFSKVGAYKRKLEWLPILFVRVFAGVFFILSGFFKLFDKTEHEALFRTLSHANFPFPEISVYAIPCLELLCGVLLIIGLLTSLAALVLFIMLVGAIVTERVAALASHTGVSLVENFLYLPECLYALLFLWLFFSGPGIVSLDHSYSKKEQ